MSLPISNRKENEKSNFYQADDLEKMTAGNSYIGFLSVAPSTDPDLPPENEVYFHGSMLNNLIPSDESPFDLSIEHNLIFNHKTSEIELKQLNLHNLIKEKINNDVTVSYYPYLKYYQPIQISSYKNSCAILLKSEDDKKLAGKYLEFKNIFNEIKTNLKNKKETFQSYFLKNFQNEFLRSYDEKLLIIPENLYNNENDKKERIYFNCTMLFMDFEEKILDLLEKKNEKTYKDLINNLKIDDIINGNKINIFKFYQILHNLDSIHTNKLIVLGEFAKQFYRNLNTESKKPFQIFYNKTLSFELPNLILPIQQIAIGNNHMLLLTIEGEIYAIGDGTKGATGNRLRKFVCNLMKVTFPYPNTIITKICCGARHSLALDNTNTLYSWGCNSNGCLGLDNTIDSFEPKTIIINDAIEQIIQIDAGDNYSAICTIDGNLYTWGNPQFNRLGLTEGTNTKIPNKVKDVFPKRVKVTHIKCGYFTMLVLTNKNTLYGFGIQTLGEIFSNEFVINDNNNLDNEKVSDYKVDLNISKLVKFKINLLDDKCLGFCVGSRFFGISTLRNNEVNFYKAGEYEMKSNIDLRLKNIFQSAIDEHYLKLQNEENSESEENEIDENIINTNLKKINNLNNKSNKVSITKDPYEFLKNISEGFKPNAYKEKKYKTKLGDIKEIKSIFCGQNNTAVVITNGDLYTFGSNIYHVSQPNIELCYNFIQPKGTKVVSVGLGANHIVMVTSSKEVYVAGRNLEGQLGLGYTSHSIDISNAKLLETISHIGAKKAYACENYSVVLTMGGKSRVWIFGDIPFLQNSFHINKQLNPRDMGWDDVEKIACGSTHLLLLQKDSNNLYNIMSVGNGMFGKLGDGDETGKNHYEPIRVELPYFEIKYKSDVKLRASKYTSAALIKDYSNKSDSIDSNSYKLYMWGLCQHELFSNLKDVSRKHKFGEEYPLESVIPLIFPTLITNYNIEDLAVGEGICYFISNPKNELINIGKFFGRKAKGKGMIVDQFKKVKIGLNHAAAISKNGKLFTWGSNVMNKLAFQNKDLPQNGFKMDNTSQEKNPNVEIDIEKYFVENPSNVVKFNEIFENNKNKDDLDVIENLIKKQNDPNEETNDNSNNQNNENNLSQDLNRSLHNGDIIEIDTRIKKPKNDGKLKSSAIQIKPNISNRKQDDNENDNELNDENENVFSKARETVIRSEFKEMEIKIQDNENLFTKRIKDILAEYKILLDKSINAKIRYKAIKNLFFFKFHGEPLNLNFKSFNKNYQKFPNDFIKYKPNYRALLSALHTHPCYLLNIYKQKLFSDQELYRIIKQIFTNIKRDKYSQLLLITICKGILAIDLAGLKSLNDYKIYHKITNETEDFNLFGRLCKFFFKSDGDFIKRQEIAGMSIVSQIFSSVETPQECENDFLLKRNPENENPDPINLTNYSRNSRVEKIMKIFDYFSNDILHLSSLEKNNLFSIQNSLKYKPLFKLPQIYYLFLSEIVKVFKTITQDTELIYDWLSKKFTCIVFHRLLKFLENPAKNIALDASLNIDKIIYKQFMDNCYDNFYSIAYAFRFCFHYLTANENNELPEDEINKQFEKVFKNNAGFCINFKNILMNRFEENNNTEDVKLNFNNEFLKEFFYHSLEDKNYIINFSLNDLIELVKVILKNHNKIRVLNNKEDILEQILNYNDLIKDGGLSKIEVDLDNDKKIQFKLKTKSLCVKNPITLMKCRNCNCILLSDYILGNESMFFEQFEFINETSSKGYFISLLKALPVIDLKNEKFSTYLKNYYEKQKENYEFKDLVNKLFTLMAVDAKEDLLITEEIINDVEKLNQIMFTQNTPYLMYKKYSEEIINKYYQMIEQLKYQNILFETLIEIENKVKEKVKSSEKFLKNINNEEEPTNPFFEEIEKEKINIFLYDAYMKDFNNLNKGYGNEEINDMTNCLNINTKFMDIINYNLKLPRSDVIMEKLPKNMKKNIKPSKDFYIHKLASNHTITNIHKYKTEILNDINNYKIIITKTEDFEFNGTLVHINKANGGLFTCGSEKNSGEDNKKILNFKIDRNLLSSLIKNCTLYKKNSSNAKEVNIDNFIDVDAYKFVKILKKLTDIGYY